MCEVHRCIEDDQNEWRDANCPDYGHIDCDCPFYVEPECPGEWNCTDIEEVSLEVLAYSDINNDG